MAPTSSRPSQSKDSPPVSRPPGKRPLGRWVVAAAIALVGLAGYGAFRWSRGSSQPTDGIAPRFDAPPGWHAEAPTRGPNYGVYSDGTAHSVTLAAVSDDQGSAPRCDRLIDGMMRGMARKTGLSTPPAATALPSTDGAVCRFSAEIPGRNQLVSGGYMPCPETSSGIVFAYFRGLDAADDQGIVKRIHCPG
jgi:hypothetical protein